MKEKQVKLIAIMEVYTPAEFHAAVNRAVESSLDFLELKEVAGSYIAYGVGTGNEQNPGALVGYIVVPQRMRAVLSADFKSAFNAAFAAPAL